MESRGEVGGGLSEEGVEGSSIGYIFVWILLLLVVEVVVGLVMEDVGLLGTSMLGEDDIDGTSDSCSSLPFL